MLGLTGMEKALEEQRRQRDVAAMPLEERLALLVDREEIERENKRLVSGLKFEGLRQNAAIEDLDTKAVRGLDKALFARLAAGDWIARRENLIILGKTGLGKSWLDCALGHKACRDDRSVLYHRDARLFDALALARGDGRHARLLKTIARVELLILDDWGLANVTAEQGHDVLEILDDRQGRGSTIVTSQVDVKHWHDMIANPTVADAILDRLVHNAHRLSLVGESLVRPREGHRRRFSDADKAWILEQAARPSVSAADVARRYGIAERVLRRWKRELSTAPVFVSMQIYRRRCTGRGACTMTALLPPSVKVHLALGYVDMRKGLDGLAMLMQGVLRQDPFTGHLFVFRGRTRANLKRSYSGTGPMLGRAFWTLGA